LSHRRIGYTAETAQMTTHRRKEQIISIAQAWKKNVVLSTSMNTSICSLAPEFCRIIDCWFYKQKIIVVGRNQTENSTGHITRL